MMTLSVPSGSMPSSTRFYIIHNFMIHCYDTAKNDHHPSLSAVVFRIKFIAVEQKSPPASIRPTVLVLLMYPFCASSIDLKTYINSK